MIKLPPWFDPLDARVTNVMARIGVPLLRISLGIVFFWFGVLKFFPGLSPAQELATRTRLRKLDPRSSAVLRLADGVGESRHSAPSRQR